MSEPQRPDRPSRKNGRPPAPGVRFGRGIFGWVLFILLAVMLFVLVQGKNRQTEKLDWGDFSRLLNNGQVRELTIEGDEITGELRDQFATTDGRKVTRFRTPIITGSADYAMLKDITER